MTDLRTEMVEALARAQAKQTWPDVEWDSLYVEIQESFRRGVQAQADAVLPVAQHEIEALQIALTDATRRYVQAETELKRLADWHPHSAVGAMHLVVFEKAIERVRQLLREAEARNQDGWPAVDTAALDDALADVVPIRTADRHMDRTDHTDHGC